mmetsp:Transcript_3561/g.8670  ORF Transcript_3561/g.8670 Transcript_3561/m.8670 type:complete len:206 (+) Transcript_3561:1089-1706(+)
MARSWSHSRDEDSARARAAARGLKPTELRPRSATKGMGVPGAGGDEEEGVAWLTASARALFAALSASASTRLAVSARALAADTVSLAFTAATRAHASATCAPKSAALAFTRCCVWLSSSSAVRCRNASSSASLLCKMDCSLLDVLSRELSASAPFSRPFSRSNTSGLTPPIASPSILLPPAGLPQWEKVAMEPAQGPPSPSSRQA